MISARSFVKKNKGNLFFIMVEVTKEDFFFTPVYLTGRYGRSKTKVRVKDARKTSDPRPDMVVELKTLFAYTDTNVARKNELGVYTFFKNKESTGFTQEYVDETLKAFELKFKHDFYSGKLIYVKLQEDVYILAKIAKYIVGEDGRNFVCKPLSEEVLSRFLTISQEEFVFALPEGNWVEEHGHLVLAKPTVPEPTPEPVPEVDVKEEDDPKFLKELYLYIAGLAYIDKPDGKYDHVFLRYYPISVYFDKDTSIYKATGFVINQNGLAENVTVNYSEVYETLPGPTIRLKHGVHVDKQEFKKKASLSTKFKLWLYKKFCK